MELLNIDDEVNYVELFFIKSTSDKKDLKIHRTDLTSDIFFDFLKKMKKTNYKFFQKEYKEYIYKDIICQIYLNDETKVYKKNVLKVFQNNSSMISIYSDRIKQTLLNFPSTINLQQTSYVKKLIFRVNNRIYINFQITLDVESDVKSYEVYINYNHEENVDTQLINKTLAEVVKSFTE